MLHDLSLRVCSHRCRPSLTCVYVISLARVQGMGDRGASLDWLSQYPHESEVRPPRHSTCHPSPTLPPSMTFAYPPTLPSSMTVAYPPSHSSHSFHDLRLPSIAFLATLPPGVLPSTPRPRAAHAKRRSPSQAYRGPGGRGRAPPVRRPRAQGRGRAAAARARYPPRLSHLGAHRSHRGRRRWRAGGLPRLARVRPGAVTQALWRSRVPLARGAHNSQRGDCPPPRHHHWMRLYRHVHRCVQSAHISPHKHLHISPHTSLSAHLSPHTSLSTHISPHLPRPLHGFRSLSLPPSSHPQTPTAPRASRAR